ncbi:lysozyme [Chryseobacterium mucoviscidosis]|uniref:lysozyme n=1 Tax=Chryseobacterium mucoviscidosis TaxID=1945581 RepID=UPI00301A17C4
MTTSQKGINFILSFEGFSAKPYLDSAGIPTIGYGNTYYPGGKKVTMKDLPITKEKGAGILANTESIEKFILFVGGCVLLFLQIRLHLIKIKKERNCEENNKKKDLED